MPFPDYPRVVYSINPLEQVICQLRFPPILRIDAELPAKFQEAIRKEYPLLEEKIEGNLEFPKELTAQLPADIVQLMGITNKEKRAYNFTSLDEKWTISLTRDFIALTSTNYSRWEDFSVHFQSPFAALLLEYEPTFFTRIGLRYKNVIRRSGLDLTGVPWSELLKPHIAGLLSSSDIEPENINGIVNRTELHLGDTIGTVMIRHGFVVDETTNEVCYAIDNDFFASRIEESQDVTNKLAQFNQYARRLFRWSITERLHQAMEPQSI